VDQGPFLNMVARIETERSPAALLELILEIERERGRERTFRNAPRTLDIDILLFGQRLVDRPGLAIPHPRMHERAFVIHPLLELDPDLPDPRTGRRFAELVAGPGAGERKAEAGEGPAGIRRLMAGEELLTYEPDE
jgi:7,8-dihydro-6-hydroxymethylpterin-pyrophosphokinase